MITQQLKYTNYSKCYLVKIFAANKLHMQFVAKRREVVQPSPRQQQQVYQTKTLQSVTKLVFVQYPVQSQTDIQVERKVKKSSIVSKKKKCAASTFILETVLPADKIQISVGGSSSQSSPSAAGCVGHQSHFQATIARYGCSNCSQLSAHPPPVTLWNPDEKRFFSPPEVQQCSKSGPKSPETACMSNCLTEIYLDITLVVVTFHIF